MRVAVKVLEDDLAAERNNHLSDRSHTAPPDGSTREDSAMAVELSTALPNLCTLLPAQYRLDVLPRLLLSSFKYCTRESQKRNLVAGLMLILKRPQKKDRAKIIEHLSKLEVDERGVEDFVLRCAMSLKDHRVEEIRLLGVQVCAKFAPRASDAYIASTLAPAWLSFVKTPGKGGSAVVRKNAVSLFPHVIKTNGCPQDTICEVVWAGLGSGHQDVSNTTVSSLIPAVVAHFADGDDPQSLWSFMSTYASKLKSSDSADFFFAAVKGITSNMPLLTELIDDEEEVRRCYGKSKPNADTFVRTQPC